jgi:hypothetical protein
MWRTDYGTVSAGANPVNMTPICVSSRQMILHVLAGSPPIKKTNSSGMPIVV